jgi:hypothetical protein
VEALVLEEVSKPAGVDSEQEVCHSSSEGEKKSHSSGVEIEHKCGFVEVPCQEIICDPVVLVLVLVVVVEEACCCIAGYGKVVAPGCRTDSRTQAREHHPSTFLRQP